MDTKNVKRKKSKAPLMIVLIVFIGLVVSFVYGIQNADRLGATPQGALAKALDVSKEQAEAVLDILQECGIEKVDSAEHDTLLDDVNEDGETGYRISAHGIDNIILYMSSDKTVSIVRYADNELYAGGSVMARLTDYTMSSGEKSEIQIKCQNAVETVLTAPATAKFPNITEWKFGKTPEKIIVQSYVDAQNGFGAMVQSEFQFVLTPDGKSVTSFVFDGQEMA